MTTWHPVAHCFVANYIIVDQLLSKALEPAINNLVRLCTTVRSEVTAGAQQAVDPSVPVPRSTIQHGEGMRCT
jgi:hypothetical protein